MEVLQKENELLETILNRTPNIIVVIKENKVVKTNSRFDTFFSKKTITCEELFQIVFFGKSYKRNKKYFFNI
jgi:hypothetical protein